MIQPEYQLQLWNRNGQTLETSAIQILDITYGSHLLVPPPVGAAMKSVKQFRATTHLAASIASEDPFTKRAVEEIKESINEGDTKDDNSDDLQKDDYIPPNRRMMLKCKQRDKWLEAEEDGEFSSNLEIGRLASDQT